MKKWILIVAMVIFGTAQAADAFVISDMKPSDPSYRSVKRAVETGYMSVYKNGKFYPKRTLTRIEMAIILDRLAQDAKKAEIGITKEEAKELKRLMTSFQNYLAKQDMTSADFVSRFGEVESEQKELNYDVTKLNENLEEMKEVGIGTAETKPEDRRLIYIGMVLAFAALLTGGG